MHWNYFQPQTGYSSTHVLSQIFRRLKQEDLANLRLFKKHIKYLPQNKILKKKRNKRKH